MTIAPRATGAPDAPATVPSTAPTTPPAELQGELDRVHRTGDELCHLLGMTSAWGAARWEAGPTTDALVPTYRVAVKGHVPDEATTDILVQRLTRHGWSGAVLSHEPILRLDAHRSTFVMRLTAEASTVRLVVVSPPVQLGRTLAAWVLAGVYEDDEIARRTETT